MEAKDLIKRAVLKAHNGNSEIVETFDFVSGALYMLYALKEMGALKAGYNFDDVDAEIVYKSIKA